MLRELSLFSGIGGFSLGLERAGFATPVACVEIDPFCQRVLAKHWPGVPIHGDVTTREFTEGEADVITGGFPCQDISFAGAGAGLAGARSGLYRHVIRAIRLVRPRYAILENVAALLSRGLGTVLGDLAEVGYDAEWHCIQASDVGLPHARNRVIVAAYADRMRELQPCWRIGYERGWSGDCRKAIDWVLSCGGILRSHDGIPASLDRVATIGNAVVPQVVEVIGRALASQETRRDGA
jgi:DNA (cytosine-5)-methyltransferase 1